MEEITAQGRRGRNATLITITGAIEEGPALPIAAPGSNLLCVIAECPRPAASSTHSKLRREIVLRRTNEGVPPQLKEERLFREVLKLPIESRQGKGAKIWGRMKGRDIPPNPETHKGRRIEEVLIMSFFQRR
ncbi:hypothetical protein QR680_004071 [Steinernema hermaphroditum]|uniref:Uncharacterized protein n=1 Tax=Steinernema hermaphroditum TaxID=289476 RepID=A0AA39HNM2_9BILA|nr:hypothetical protein QR680_004071 [Steinernema hermaphroditum]